MTRTALAPAVGSAEHLWAAYRRQNRYEDQAWQAYKALSDQAREAFTVWSLAKHHAEQAYVAYRRRQDEERQARHHPGTTGSDADT